MNVGKFLIKNIKTSQSNNTPALSRSGSRSNLTKYIRSDSENKLLSSSTTVNQSANQNEFITNREKYEINSSSLNKSKNVGERLFNYSKYLNLKKDKMRVSENLERFRSMSPSISKKAKSIERDPKLFVERLYPNEKVSNLSSFEGESFFNDCDHIEEVYGNKSFVHHYKKKLNTSYDDFKYKPKLCQNSLRMASKMEPAKIRLTSKKKKNLPKSKSIDIFTFSNVTKSNFKSNNFKSNNTNRVRNPIEIKNTPSIEYEHTKNNRFCKSSFLQTLVSNLVEKKPVYGTYNQLYEKGMEAKKKRSNIYDEGQKKVKDEFRQFSFKPEINNSCKHEINGEHFYDKNNLWKQGVNSKIQQRKFLRENEAMKECTFTPKIEPKIPNPDLLFIDKHFVQTNNYIAKRRETLLKQEEEKLYAKKKLNLDENFKITRTTCKEFHLHQSASKMFLKEEIHKKNLSSIKKMRKKLNIEDFFEDNEENYSVIIIKEPKEIEYSQTPGFLEDVSSPTQNFRNNILFD